VELDTFGLDGSWAMAFTHDVFLSHSAADKAVVRALAERLRSDGLRVWLDQWEIRPGDSIPSRIEEGLAGSRILVLCMSAAAFGSDWARLESQTFQFRDPLNRERRFIPLQLDDTEPKGSLAQFLYVDWRAGRAGAEGRGKRASYAKLLESCWHPATVLAADEDRVPRGEVSFAGHTAYVMSVALSADGRHALSGSNDKTVRLWAVASTSGRVLTVFGGHTGSVTSVAFSADGSYALSGSIDETVRHWEVATGRALGVFHGHTGPVTSVALSADGRHRLQERDAHRRVTVGREGDPCVPVAVTLDVV
jgi:hypothetical protein